MEPSGSFRSRVGTWFIYCHITDLKIVVLGHGGVGKTSLINRYIHDRFSETISTIGAALVLKKWHTFYFGIWDTAGQDKYTKISTYYSKGAQAAIICYDITERKTFDTVEKYVGFLKDADPKCYVVLVGTKLDLVISDPERRQVSVEDLTAITEKYRAAHYETSAKDNTNIADVFDNIGFHCLASRLEEAEKQKDKSSLAGQHTSTPHPTMCCNCLIQ